MSARLRTTDLAIGYGAEVVADHLDITVQPEEIVAIIGSSGSGKSTLLATIAGIIPALAGQIYVDGADVTRAPVHRRGIGVIFQEPLLFGHLDVADNVAYGLRRQGLSRSIARAEASALLAWLGLADFENRPVDQLSGGQAQRVALARALAPRPAILLLDEPFSALDAELRARLATEVAAAIRQQGAAALHVTHDRGEAQAMADRVVSLPARSA